MGGKGERERGGGGVNEERKGGGEEGRGVKEDRKGEIRVGVRVGVLMKVER